MAKINDFGRSFAQAIGDLVPDEAVAEDADVKQYEIKKKSNKTSSNSDTTSRDTTGRETTNKDNHNRRRKHDSELFEISSSTEQTDDGDKDMELISTGEVKIDTEKADEVNAAKTAKTAKSTYETEEASYEDRLDSDSYDSVYTYINKSTVIKGNLDSVSDIVVAGKVVGDIVCKGTLTVSGEVKGKIRAEEVIVLGAVIDGDIISNTSVIVRNSDADCDVIEGENSQGSDADGAEGSKRATIITGNISCESAYIAGAVRGDLDIHGVIICDKEAVIMGNIKSKSIEIKNGAVIEGFFSQCYSDVSAKSYFPKSALDY